MVGSKFWHDLEAQFRELSCPFDLRADWNRQFGTDRVRWGQIVGFSSRLRLEDLARQAGAAVGSAGADSLEAWLNLIWTPESVKFPGTPNNRLAISARWLPVWPALS
jgi:hypothetical protein